MGWVYFRCFYNDIECDEFFDFVVGSFIEIEFWLFVLLVLVKWFFCINNCFFLILEVNVL